MASPVCVFALLLGLSVASCVNFTTVYEWGAENKMDYAWPTEETRTKALQYSAYNPGNIQPRYLAAYEQRLFLSLNRAVGIRVSLVSLPTSSASPNPPGLSPFPSWQHYEKYSSCGSIGDARGLEVGADGRLWVADNGRGHCNAKLWIFDLANNDTVGLVHQFPQEVVPHDYHERMLQDLVLDETPEDTIAYIADLKNEHIVAFSPKRNESWAVQTPGKSFSSLALSPREESRQLYLGSGYSRDLYTVPVTQLRARRRFVNCKLVGDWTNFPKRMLVDSNGVLYAALFYSSYVSTWNTTLPFSEQKFYEVGIPEVEWPFTFALDAAGTFWMTQWNDTGYERSQKLLKTALGTRSYLFGA